MISEIIVFGGFFFWTLFVLMSMIAASMLSCSRTWEAGFCIILFVVTLILFSNFNPIAWIGAHPIWAIVILVAYVGIGTVWAIAKWYMFVTKRYRAYRKARDRFMTLHRHDGEEAEIAWRRQVSLSHDIRKPVAAKHRSTIIGWMAYWPWSILETMLTDAIHEAYLFIHGKVSSTLDAISAKIYRDAEPDDTEKF